MARRTVAGQLSPCMYLRYQRVPCHEAHALTSSDTSCAVKSARRVIIVIKADTRFSEVDHAANLGRWTVTTEGRKPILNLALAMQHRQRMKGLWDQATRFDLPDKFTANHAPQAGQWKIWIHRYLDAGCGAGAECPGLVGLDRCSHHNRCVAGTGVVEWLPAASLGSGCFESAVGLHCGRPCDLNQC